MFQAKIVKIAKLGEADPTYGQRYWGEISDDLTPISFNSKNLNIEVGADIAFEEKAMKQSAKGTTYWQLKKVKLLEAEQPVSSQISTTQLDRIEAEIQELHSKLDKLLSIDEDLRLDDD